MRQFVIETINFKNKCVQIDLFGLSVSVLTEEKMEYLFYVENDDSDKKSCYLKSKLQRKKQWSKPNLLKTNIAAKARFEFSDENEFGFVLK